MLKHPVAWLLVFAAVALAIIGAIMGLASRQEDASTRAAPVGVGQKHMLVSLHQRRQPSWQLTWNAPDGATGYTVYVTKKCPSLICDAPTCTINPDGGPDGGPLIVGTCNGCFGSSLISLDAGTCTCLNDAGQAICNNAAVSAAQIDAGGCSNPALCCVTYPGAPAPAGQHDGIIVSQCYRTHADGGAVVDGAISLYVDSTGYMFDVEAH